MSTNFPPESDPEWEELKEQSGETEPAPFDNPTEDPAKNTVAETQLPSEEPNDVITDISQLPPEAQGEANGGPLGCCLGSSIGILLTVVIAVIARLYPDALNGFLIGNLRLVMACAGLLGVCVFGYLGWKIGRRLYKEYDPPVIKNRRRKKKKPALKSS